MERNVASSNTKYDLTLIPQNVLRNIFYRCSVKELGRLSQTCHYFQELVSDRLLWQHLCWRDFNLLDPNLGPLESHYMLYKKLLHKYGSMFGTYLICYGENKSLAEIKYRDGTVECIEWIMQELVDLEAPLLENVVFQISDDGSHLCCASRYCHLCQLSFNEVRGTVKQICLDEPRLCSGRLSSSTLPILDEVHIGITKQLYGCMLGRTYRPIILPSPDSLPHELKRFGDSIPSRLITPGLFKGGSPIHCVSLPQILCFRYKNEYEILGLEVVARCCHRDGISLKIFVQKALLPSLDEQKSFEALLDCDSEQDVFSTNLSQPFVVPEGCQAIGTIPSTCIARYKGFMRIAGMPEYIAAHVIIFSDDLIGVLMLGHFKTFHIIRRIHQKFTPNILTEVESAV